MDAYWALGDDGSLGLVLVEAILYRRLLQIQNTCKRTEANDEENKLNQKKCYKKHLSSTLEVATYHPLERHAHT
jgi:hypothetical protein